MILDKEPTTWEGKPFTPAEFRDMAERHNHKIGGHPHTAGWCLHCETEVALLAAAMIIERLEANQNGV